MIPSVSMLLNLSEADYLAHARIIAFDWQVLRLVREAEPTLATGHLVIPKPFESRIVRDSRGASPWTDGADPVHFGGSLGAAVAAHGGMQVSLLADEITPELQADAADHGLSVAAWGLHEPEEIPRLAALGVESVTLSGPRWVA